MNPVKTIFLNTGSFLTGQSSYETYARFNQAIMTLIKWVSVISGTFGILFVWFIWGMKDVWFNIGTLIYIVVLFITLRKRKIISVVDTPKIEVATDVPVKTD